MEEAQQPLELVSSEHTQPSRTQSGSLSLLALPPSRALSKDECDTFNTIHARHASQLDKRDARQTRRDITLGLGKPLISMLATLGKESI